MKRKPRPARMAELVADTLRRQIFEGVHDAGLAKEEALREQFGVAKSSMREALLILETEGLITVRRGNIGGSSVHLPTIESAAYSIGLSMSAGGATLGDVAEALQVLEPMCAAFCARLADRGEKLVPELDQLNSAYEDEIDDGLAVSNCLGNSMKRSWKAAGTQPCPSLRALSHEFGRHMRWIGPPKRR